MPKLHTLAALVAALAMLVLAATATAAPVTVHLRVEGSTQTLFDGPITTDAKSLTKDASGPHPCDGTNLGANPSPGPTMTGAMDDGATSAGFTWDASWDAGYQDFLINRIGPDTNTGGPAYQPYWGYFQNWVATQVGGCQQQVAQGDDVLFAYGDYGQPLLQLTAPARAATGESFQVTVQQNDGTGGRTSAPGATVQGETTDPSGNATISFTDPGVHSFKATRTGSIRSNAAGVCVYTPGSGDCGTEKAAAPGEPPPSSNEPAPEPQPAAQPAAKDSTPPTVKVTSLEPGKDYGQGPRVLAGDVDDTGGIAQVFLRLRSTDGGGLTAASRCRWFSGKRGVFTHRTVPCSKARFFRIGNSKHFSYLLPARLGHGRYTFEVKVLDRAYNAGRSAVPFGVK
jgi:hypothetical protein